MHKMVKNKQKKKERKKKRKDFCEIMVSFPKNFLFHKFLSNEKIFYVFAVEEKEKEKKILGLIFSGTRNVKSL